MTRMLIKNASIWKWMNGPSPGSPCRGDVVSNQRLVIERGIITSLEAQNDAETSDSKDFDTVIDAGHRLVLPGLIDSHIHVALLGESQHYVNLEDCFSIEEMLQRVKAASEVDQDLPFVVGFNWDQSKVGRLPTRYDLDGLNIDKPVFLWRACWHIGVANSRALQISNILQESSPLPEIAGGAIDVSTDEPVLPTGILRERAVEPVVKALSAFKSFQHTLRFIKEGMALCVDAGLTSVQTNDEGGLGAYLKLIELDEVPLRIMLTPTQSELSEVIEVVGGPRPIFNSILSEHLDASTSESRLGVERVKIFSDGSLGAETAAILLSLDINGKEFDDLKFKGMLIHSSKSLEDMILKSMKAGFRLEIHAIGDAAAAQVIYALEKSLEIEPLFLTRPIITHCQVLHPLLIEKMSRLGIIANVQPSFVPTDMRWVMSRLTAEQISSSYAWKTLMYSNVHVAGGSDAPIENPSPLRGIHDAIFRTNARKTGISPETASIFRPMECLSFAEALWMYTVEGAFAGGCEDLLGRIDVGYVADLVIVDPDCVSNNHLLFDLRPDMVMVGGRVESVDKSSVVKVNGSISTRPLATFEPNVESSAPFVPGRGGSVGNCQVVGFCSCFLKQQYCV